MQIISKYIRGNAVDTFHIGYAIAVDERGNLIFAAGDPDYPIYARCLAKPFQAAAMLEAQIDEKFKINDEEIAVICGSHNGEIYHTETVTNILKKINETVETLVCPPQVPFDRASYEQLILRGHRPGKLHNPCSGEHAGMIAMARALNTDPKSYYQIDHEVQRKIYEKIKHYAKYEKIPTTTDNCGVATYFMTLRHLALMYKQLINAEDDLLRKVYQSIILHPRMIGGRNRLDTDLITHLGKRCVSISGFEGVRGIGIRDEEGRAIGIVIKVLSGNQEVCDSMTLALLRYLNFIDEETLKKFEQYYSQIVRTVNDIEVSKLITEIS